MVDMLDPKFVFGPLSSIDRLKPVIRQHNSMYKKKNNQSRKKEINRALDKSRENNKDASETSLDDASDFNDAKDNKSLNKRELNKKLIDIKI